ncbi:GDSL-type esterase/lipase family protein [Labilibaculum sp. K2S]|uniref:GDSL-type esterase/lipase family protein n=1 Tax=Labilibaculum sp. K2S TaxID=3056386 RepID=UPI0025A3857F|nr:GDSL-type esterase/lipase family protein [Labilibaculum sp. K2S]MDM8160806.1 GDSL-type esterase/lipase family protein [Labilibaculum sp. K2S]
MKNRIAFLGDSLTEGGCWEEYFPASEISNFGISGERSDEILFRLDKVLFWEPKKIFLMMGINDLGEGLSYENILANYQKIVSILKEHKHIELIVQSLLPTNDSLFKSANFNGMKILELNYHLRDLCEKEKITYVDLYTAFSTYTYQLIKDYTNDGLHLNEAGYRVWKNCLQSQNLI